MNPALTSATAENKRLQLRKGKDHLNLADWPICLPSRQQPRKADGGKLDYFEFAMTDRSGQKVTLMAPSRIGLPTAADQDVVIGLQTLARHEHNFAEDLFHYVPHRLFDVLRWPSNGDNYDRLEAALTRLRALTVKYEHTWYDRESGAVQPVLITGILGEAKLVLRRGRCAQNAVPDSYIQWTHDYYQSLKNGTLTDLDLDLYFSLTRPTAKQLLRHLNKRFHRRSRDYVYERDLKQLACGHFGMVDSKFLRRNFHAGIAELEERGFLRPCPPEERYVKVRPGVYRVRFQLNADDAPSTTTSEQGTGPAYDIVSRWHAAFHRRCDHRPIPAELAYARSLIDEHSAERIERLVPKLARIAGQYFPDAVHFHAAKDHYRNVIRHDCRKQQEAEQPVERLAEDTGRQAHRERLFAAWAALSNEERIAVIERGLVQIDSAFARDRIDRWRKRGELDDPPLDVLLFLERYVDA